MSALPPNPNLTHLKNQAKALRKSLKAGEPQAFKRLREALPHYQSQPDDALRALTLVEAQLVIAREYGFAGWVALREAVRTSDLDPADREVHLLEAVIQNDAATANYRFVWSLRLICRGHLYPRPGDAPAICQTADPRTRS